MLGELEADRKAFLLLAEVGLVLTLFSDATRINLQVLKSNESLPIRLLGIGMLPTILLGAVGAAIVFPQLSLWEASILGAILAPTDAGLGEVIVNSPRVPVRIRQALNVEAGLNDGLSVPFLMFFIALAEVGTEGAGARVDAIRRGAARLRRPGRCGDRPGGRMAAGTGEAQGVDGRVSQQLGLVALPLLCVMGSKPCRRKHVHRRLRRRASPSRSVSGGRRKSVEFTEGWGRLLDFFVFFLFGMLSALAWNQFSTPPPGYTALSASRW